MTDGATLTLLLVTAASTAVFHTLIPDHWLPFVLMGRARGWSARTTAAVSGLSAAVHTALSAALALAALALGIQAAHAAGETLEHASAVLLVVFGLAYAAWAWRKGGHFHPGGDLLHRAAETPRCSGGEGESDEHLHYHADEALIRGVGDRSALALAAIVGINPCVLILPIVLKTHERGGAGAVAWVVAAYSATTVALMVGLSVLGVVGTARIRLPAAARHMEAASGLVIAAAGLAFLLLAH